MKKIRSQISISFIVFSMIPVCLIIILFLQMIVQSMNEKIEKEVTFNLEQVARNVEWQVEKLNSNMQQVLSNKDVQQILRTGVFDNTQSGYMDTIQDLDIIFESLLYSESDFKYAVLLPRTGGSYTYGGYIYHVGQLRDTDEFARIDDYNGKIFYRSLLAIDNNDNMLNTYSLSGVLVKDVLDKGDLEKLGTYILLMKDDFLSRIFSESSRQSDSLFILIDNERKVVAEEGSLRISDNSAVIREEMVTDQDQGMYNVDIGDETVAVYFFTSRSTGWSILHVIPASYFTTESQRIFMLAIVVIISSVFFVLVTSFFLSKYISRPITTLHSAMQRVRNKDFEVSVPVQSDNELGVISEGFNSMVQDIKQLFENIVKEGELKRKAQLAALRYQINPHFLYNTLNSIGMYASLQGATDISEMTSVLERLLRNKISTPDLLIPLSKEISNIKDYIFILQIRFEQGIHAVYAIDEKTDDLCINSFLMQPLVENAIYHGLNRKLNTTGETAVIKISACTERDRLFVDIRDNGCGMSPEEIEQAMLVNDQFTDCAAGIGIKNINNRIGLMYGEGFGIAIESEVGSYTCIRLILPVIKREEGYPNA